ncbi:MAG: TIGR03862 family flavoprotein [Sneathiella sp.]
MTDHKKRIAIIGGGPAGLIAAQFLSALNKYDIHLYEQKASVGRKFLIAGRGGLNLTHSEDATLFNNRYGWAEAFLTPYLSRFTPNDLRAWAADLGIETFVGSSGRVFPREMKATNLMRAWTKKLTADGVTFHLRQTFTAIDKDNRPCFTDQTGEEASINADAYLFALGGASYPHLGADGRWSSPLEKQGIALSPFKPMNCGFDVSWSSHILKFEGQPLKNIAFSLGPEIARGDAVLTRYGLEGGVIYALSRSLVLSLDQGGTTCPVLDLRPDLSATEISERLTASRGKQSMPNYLRKRLKFSPIETALLRELTGNVIASNPIALAKQIKALPVTVNTSRPISQAISTSGGILMTELDDQLMLRKHPGWFAAGEMIDWDAPTGGYLLQACFSTGIAAAKGMENWLERN